MSRLQDIFHGTFPYLLHRDLLKSISRESILKNIVMFFYNFHSMSSTLFSRIQCHAIHQFLVEIAKFPLNVWFTMKFNVGGHSDSSICCKQWTERKNNKLDVNDYNKISAVRRKMVFCKRETSVLFCCFFLLFFNIWLSDCIK